MMLGTLLDELEGSSSVIFATVLGPVVGLVGARLKGLFDKRDARAQSAHLLSETTRLMRFQQNLGSSVSPTAERARGVLDRAIEKNLDAIMNCYSAPAVVQPKAERTLFERAFLLYRPHRLWEWLLHVIYFGALGVIAIAAALTVSDKKTEPEQFVGDVWVLFGFTVCLAAWNLFTNWVDKRTKPASAAQIEGAASLSHAAGK